MSDLIRENIAADIAKHPVLLFMKGTRLMPACGFSSRVIGILNAFHIPYTTRNVLEDDNLRRGIKEYSNWPTLPQLYIQGQFIGGCDIVVELYESGELARLLEKASLLSKTPLPEK